jgi:hypothetical protein
MRSVLIEAYYNGPEYLRKLQARANQLRMCEADPLQRARLIMDVWAVDPVAFIEDFGFIQMPEFQNSVKPFFLFDYQKKIINRLLDAELSGLDEEILIDKPRGMGLTWLISAYIVWRWLFTPNWSGFVLSRTETEVDDGSADPSGSIFGKIRFMLAHMPPWILPEGFKAKGAKGTSTDSKLRLLNPQMGTVIAGSSTNSNAGRSRRYSFIFADECFSIERFTEVWRSLQSVARIKVFVSTVKPGRVFKEFKELIDAAGNYISLSWKDHPFKDQIWYDEQIKKAEFDPEVMKEISADYSLNPKSQYYPEVAQARVEDLIYDRKLPLYCFLDFGKQDLTVIGWAQFDGREVRILDCYSNSQRPLEFYVPFLNPQIAYNPEKYPDSETLRRVRSYEKPNGYFGEQAHFKSDMPTNSSIAKELSKFGIRLIYNQYAIQYEPRRQTAAMLLPRTVFNRNNPRVMELFDALANSRYTSSIAATSKVSVMKPVHDDGIADYRAAFENLCVNLSRVIKAQRERVQEEDHETRGFYKDLIKYLRV